MIFIIAFIHCYLEDTKHYAKQVKYYTELV